MKPAFPLVDCARRAALAMAALLTFHVSGAFAQRQDSVEVKIDHHRHNQYAELANAPEEARAKPNPLADDPDAIAAGKKLFEQHCAKCHGTAAEGRKKAPSLQVEEVQRAAPGTLFWILTNGVVRRGMPVWSKLPEQQRWQLVSFIKSLGHSAANETAKKAP